MAVETKVLLIVMCGALGIGLGVIIGYFSNNSSDTVQEAKPEADPSISNKIINSIEAKNIEENLRILTSKPHIAGRNVEEVELVDLVADRFRNAGLSVEIYPYNVLLSYPNQTDSNYVSILHSNGSEISKSQSTEKILDQSQNKSGVVNPFNAYSPPGDPRGNLVYVNYATIDDFLELERDLNGSTKGHICIARYGKIYRGDKANHAFQYGCTGLILYSDPEDYTVPYDGVYPDSWYLPGTGAQRGSLYLYQGDPESLLYPSIDTVWRTPEENISLPNIPVTPIGYDDAMKYLANMAGPDAPDSWQGGLNIIYKLGPGFRGELKNSKMKMHVTTRNERATIHNVIGYFEGAVEPDRYVIFGNHRDAWVFGAIDPSSGTAAMLELVRVYGMAVKDGWKPRRTIVFCSWGAEEYGLIGSTEWVEEFQKALGSRAVAYLNVDIAVQGNYTMRANSLPNLVDVIYESAKLISNPDPSEIDIGRNTVYDTWKAKLPQDGNSENTVPQVGSLGSGSDYTMFLQVTGISALDIRYTLDMSLDLGSYPVYHSVYETFDLVKVYVDPDFKYHQAVARLWGEIGRRLIDNPLLPLNCVRYAAALTKDKDQLIVNFGEKMINHEIDLGQINSAVHNFMDEASALHKRTEILDTRDKLALRAVNDQLMYLDRAFVDINGIEGRAQYRHVIYAPSQHNSYAGTAFPGLVDSMFDIEADSDQEGRWEEVRRQYSILVYHIGSAASTLRDVVPIKGYSNS